MSDGVASAGPPPRRAWTGQWRTALFVVGLGAMALVVRKVGPATVAAALLSAGAFLPLMIGLEAAWISMDILVLRAVLGERAALAPWRAYAQSSVTAYSVYIFFPAGRLSGEVSRAAMLSPYFGASRVAVAAMQVQGAGLLGTTFVALCAVVAAVRELGPRHPLPLVIALSALMTGSLGAMLLFGSRAPRLWGFVQKRIPRLPDFEHAASDSSSRPGRAVLLSSVARAIQCLLFTTIVYAAAGTLSLWTGSIAQGISLAGSAVGDVVPQQAGIAEGAFLYFAGALGLADAPGKAVSIALMMRVCQLSLATLCLIISALWRRELRPIAPPQQP